MVKFVSPALLILLLVGTLPSRAWAQSGDPSASGNPLPDAPASQVPSADGPVFSTSRAKAPIAIPAASPDPATFSLEGKHATLSLVSEVSSKLPSGSAFQARLENPITANGQTVLPKGSLLAGHFRTVHARHLMRPGSVFLMFEQAVLPNGAVQPLHANLVSAASDAVRADTEGVLRPAISKKRLLIQFGGAGLAAKFADDLAQVAGGTAVSAATARYAGLGAAATFLVVQKGREVRLRAGDSLDVEFGREAAVQVHPAASPGKSSSR